MIKIEKDLSIIPTSLIPAFEDLFESNRIIRTAITTHKKRISLIDSGQYIDDDNYNSRYKLDDIKLALNDIYHGKCAFCEQSIEQSQVEHYRPKSKYYWLAYSWDNLILACPRCNQGKGINFDLRGTRISFINNEQNVRQINNSSASYDNIEQPLMVNPEVTDPLGLIFFDRDGLITSTNARFAYTIEKCAIDRNYLNDQRRKIIDDFNRDIRSILVESKDVYEQSIAITVIVKKFIRDSTNVKTPFLAFRRFAISEKWLNTIIKSLN